MASEDTLRDYLDEISKQLYSGHATEHSYRPALKALLNALDESIEAINEPKQSEHGAPDFIIIGKKNKDLKLGYGEAKIPGENLDKIEKSEQMDRYKGYTNLFLTDCFDWRFFRNGDKIFEIKIGELNTERTAVAKLNKANYSILAQEIANFLNQTPESIRNGKRLAEIMGGKARRIRDNILLRENISPEIESIYEMMKKLLVHDLSHEKFADMYAQTLVYGLFVARYMDTSEDDFSRQEARDLVPKSNPFLRHFFDHIVGPDFDTGLGYIVDELCEIFSVSDVAGIVHKHLRVGDESTDAKDPIIHFYEDFLQEYDPKIRKDMGAYYTPTPVVKFIVRHVDKILREDFGIAKGLASDETFTKQVDIGQEVSVLKAGKTRVTKTSVIDKKFHRVQVLDPAVGTATFLNETIKFIYEQFKGQEGRWPSYVADDLIQRLHGFELMMAPYTIAHLKLGMTLKETGVENLPDRLGVYLTNTLEEGVPRQRDLFSFGLAQAVSEESQHAADIKSERPIMIIMGNPPYSGESSNNTPYANSLVNKYKVEPGGQQKLQEKNAKWLNDDYVKFVAFSENMINKNGSGIIAMITNNGYLDNPTFRGMRWHLAKTFDKIYVLDLHGNSKKQEMATDGGKDENVFDIMQGVGIILAVKNGNKGKELADVYHSEITGSRASKFALLKKDDVQWSAVALDAKFMTFQPTGNPELKLEYDHGISLVDLFISNTLGFQTHRDDFAIAGTAQEIKTRIEDFISDDRYEKVVNQFDLKDSHEWQIASARKRLATQSDETRAAHTQEVAYRPFDNRYTYFDDNVSDRPRSLFKDHISNRDNLVLGVGRQGLAVGNIDWCLVTVSEHAMDANMFRRGGVNAFPLYLYHDDETRTVNFDTDELKKLTANLTTTYEPENICDYIYATLYSPQYREKYKEFLKSDFPRIPVPTQVDFDRLVLLGRELRELHLMKSAVDYETTFAEAGDNMVEQLKYSDGEVWINDIQYFGNVPDKAWNFYIGGYQPAQKWLKDRKGRALTSTDLDHYQKMIKILLETDRIMKEIG